MKAFLRRIALSFGLLIALSGCGSGGEPSGDALFTIPATSDESPEPAAASTSAGASESAWTDLPVLSEGPVTPGTYLILPPDAGWLECMDDVDCGPAPAHAESLQLQITVPSGWESGLENTVIQAEASETSEATDGAALVLGWYPVGLHSDPCRPVSHSTPDILVGPKVEDFVDAVVAHPSLEVAEPVDLELGGYPGQFFTLTAPSDISDCADWRPWEHGIPAQGPDNIWNVWVIDVDGLRMVLLAEEFPATPGEVSAELKGIVESIQFVPSP